MATLGSTAEPTTGQAWFGLNSTNHHAVLLTLPSGGPWEISRVGAWCAGKDETANVKVCVWSAAGSLLAQTATFNLAGQSFAVGNNTKAEGDLVSPVTLSGGTQVYVGIARDPADDTQFGTRSGSRLDKTSASWPASIAGGSSVSGAIGAYIADYHTSNVAPNAPFNLSPTANAVVHSGTAPSLYGARSDPDPGDYITHLQVVVYADNGTTVVYDSGIVDVSGSPTAFAQAVSLPAAHAFYRWKARTWDKAGLAGPYSAQQRFYANAVPATPAPTTIINPSTLTPVFGGAFSDSGDSMAAIQIEVGLNSSPYSNMWYSGELAESGASWERTYTGTALSWSTAYRVRNRVQDSHGGWSGWSAWKGFVTTQPTGPDNNTPRTTNPRLNDLTPDLTVGHSAAFRNDEVQVAATAALGGFGTTLWNKTWEGSDYANVTSKVRTYAGSALSWGGTYVWRTRIELADGTITGWSLWHPIRMNATPSSPTGMTPAGGLVLTDTTPTLHADFADADLDQGDAASLIDIEVRDNSDDSLDWSQSAAAPSGAGGLSHEVSTGTLVAEKTYKWRARFTDTMGRQGSWSTYQLFKVSVAPVATLTSPANAAVVTVSTPTLDWGYSSSGGKAQYSYRVRVFDKGPTGANYADEVLAYDSAERIGTDTEYSIPRGTLENDHDYRWSVTVKDTDLLTHELT